MPSDPKYQRVQVHLKALEKKVKQLSDDVSPKTARPTIKLGRNMPLIIKKALSLPEFKNKTVLTDSTWRYVEIYLNKSKVAGAKDALFYWQQANNFYEATKSLDLISSPLTTYYCFLNATKALLILKGVKFDTKHGVSGAPKDGHVVLQNEVVTFKTQGILSSLCRYLGEPIDHRAVTNPSTTRGFYRYNLKDMLYNLEYIHRAYTLTYPRETELFIPIVLPRFVYDKSRKKGWFETQLEKEHSNSKTLNKLKGYSLDRKYDNTEYYTIRRNRTFEWYTYRNKPTTQSEDAMQRYYKNIRNQLRYIYSPSNLWYIKRRDNPTGLIERSSLTLTFAAMHRLSELARYDPRRLSKHLEKDSNWLLSEFITKSLYQFIDQISSEITGDDFRVTGFRA